MFIPGGRTVALTAGSGVPRPSSISFLFRLLTWIDPPKPHLPHKGTISNNDTHSRPETRRV